MHFGDESTSSDHCSIRGINGGRKPATGILNKDFGLLFRYKGDLQSEIKFMI